MKPDDLPWATCRYCLEALFTHADNKCLWDYTYYERAQCLTCERGRASGQMATYIPGTAYFMCIDCDFTYFVSNNRIHNRKMLDVETRRFLVPYYLNNTRWTNDGSLRYKSLYDSL